MMPPSRLVGCTIDIVGLFNHNTDGISRVRETGRNQSALIQISRSGFAAKNKKVLIFLK
jgi:hypothetical protein